MHVPDFMPRLRSGAGETPKDGGCLIQVAGYLNDGVSWTDATPCVHPALRRAGILVNDGVDDEYRQRLLLLAPRLIGTGGTGDPVEDRRIAVELARWCAADAKESAAAPASAEAAASASASAAGATASASAAGATASAAGATASAAFAASYAAFAAVYAASADARSKARFDFLVRLIDAYDHITGRTVTGKTVTEADWRRVADAMSPAN